MNFRQMILLPTERDLQLQGGRSGALAPHPQPLVSALALWARAWQGLSGTARVVSPCQHPPLLTTPTEGRQDSCLPLSQSPGSCLSFPAVPAAGGGWGSFVQVRFQRCREQRIPLPTVPTVDNWSLQGCAGHRQLCHGLWEPGRGDRAAAAPGTQIPGAQPSTSLPA